MKPKTYWMIALALIAIIFLLNLATFNIIPIVALMIIGYGYIYRKGWANFVYFPYFGIMLLISVFLIYSGLTISYQSAGASGFGTDLSKPDFEEIPGAINITGAFEETAKEYFSQVAFAILITGIINFVLNSLFLFVGWKARRYFSEYHENQL